MSSSSDSSSSSSSSRGSSRYVTNTEESNLIGSKLVVGTNIFITPPIPTGKDSDNPSPRTISLASNQLQQRLPQTLPPLQKAPSQNPQMPPPISSSQIPPPILSSQIPPPIPSSQITPPLGTNPQMPPILNPVPPLPNSNTQMPPHPSINPQLPLPGSNNPPLLPPNKNSPQLPPTSPNPKIPPLPPLCAPPPHANIPNFSQAEPIQVFLLPPPFPVNNSVSYQTYNSQPDGYLNEPPGNSAPHNPKNLIPNSADQNPDILFAGNYYDQNQNIANNTINSNCISIDPGSLTSSCHSVSNNGMIIQIPNSNHIIGEGYQSNSVFQNVYDPNYVSANALQPQIIQPPMIYQQPCYQGETQPSAISEETLYIIKLSRLCRILIMVRLCLILIYMIPVYYILPLLLFEIIGYLGARNLNNCLNIGYTVYLSISLLVRTIIIIAFGVATEKPSDSRIDYYILILVLVVFIIVEFFEIVQLYFETKLSVRVGKINYEKNAEIIRMMKTTHTKWFQKS